MSKNDHPGDAAEVRYAGPKIEMTEILHRPNEANTHCKGCNWPWPCWGSMAEDMCNEVLVALCKDSDRLTALLDPSNPRTRVQIFRGKFRSGTWVTTLNRAEIDEVSKFEIDPAIPSHLRGQKSPRMTATEVRNRMERIRVMVVARRWRGLLKRIPEGGMYPRFYGYAWRDWGLGEAWCAPVPLNLIISGARWFWYRLKHGVNPHALEEAEGVVKLMLTRKEKTNAER